MKVAPLVGAWIETRYLLQNVFALMVAPLVGAWIETHSTSNFLQPASVAPLVGAWIETLLFAVFACLLTSHLS